MEWRYFLDIVSIDLCWCGVEVEVSKTWTNQIKLSGFRPLREVCLDEPTVRKYCCTVIALIATVA